MFKCVLTVEGKNNRKKRIIEFECDNCKKKFTKGYCKHFVCKDKLTFCSVECSKEASRPDGISNQKSKNILKKNSVKIKEKKKKLCLERYGVEHHTMSDDVKEKFKKTCLKKYGVDNPKKSKIIQEKIKNTCLERYGVEYAIQSSEVKKKREESWMKKYNGHPMTSQSVKDKIKKTCIDRYGVDNCAKSSVCKKKTKETYVKKYGLKHSSCDAKVQKRSRQTCLERYGVEYVSQVEDVKKKVFDTWNEKYGCHPLQLDEIKEQKKKTCLIKYGVDHPMKSDIVLSKFDYKELWRKSHETMKKNGTYGKSKIEDNFYDYLCDIYGENSVERQVKINEWQIDFYIETNNVYIQFDGVYWHGLDRPVKLIKESSDKRDKSIYMTYLKDKNQNMWFEKNKMVLIRVTDREFKKEKERVCEKLLNYT